MLDVLCKVHGFLATVDDPIYIAGVANNHSSAHSGGPIQPFILIEPHLTEPESLINTPEEVSGNDDLARAIDEFKAAKKRLEQLEKDTHAAAEKTTG
jgi:hypothetical protein